MPRRASEPSGHFEKGVAEGAVDPSFNPVMALRLSVLKDSAVWAILSEVSGPDPARPIRASPVTWSGSANQCHAMLCFPPCRST